MKPLSECRVLIVDDARPNVDILVSGLREEYKLSVAMSGEAALKQVEKTPPDLVLLDIVMPGLDGYETCRRLREMPAMADVPIVFLSSLDDIGNKAKGFEAGANDYITKPFDILEVKVRTRSLLKAKAYGDAIKEQMAADLRIAHSIQMGMIPSDFSRCASDFGLDIAAVLEPAREIGGDLYGVFPVSRERLVIVMGDVSGKGIPAALFMVRASTVARMLARDVDSPEKILERLNDELSEENPSCMFVTLACAVYDPRTRCLAIANGGHPRPVTLSPGRQPAWSLSAYGVPLGLEAGMEFKRTDIQLQPGDAIVLYTDGVTEAFDPDSALYGYPRLLSDLAEAPPGDAAGVVSHLLARVKSFAAGAPQSDDIAILVLRALEPAPHRELSFRATPQEVMEAVEQLRRFCEGHGVGARETHCLSLALEEMGSNIVNHACCRRAEEVWRLAMHRDPDAIRIELCDQGPPFDPTAQPEPELGAALEDREPGGLGIVLVRRNLDCLEYERKGDCNILRMVRRLLPSPPGPA